MLSQPSSRVVDVIVKEKKQKGTKIEINASLQEIHFYTYLKKIASDVYAFVVTYI